MLLIESRAKLVFYRKFGLLSARITLTGIAFSAVVAGCGENSGDPITAQPHAGAPSQAGTASGGSAGTTATTAGSSGSSALGGTSSGGSAGGGVNGGGAGASGAGGAAGNSGGGGSSGSGGNTPIDPCAAGPWTCLGVDGNTPYGTHTFDVPAQQNWVNTGLYLRTGTFTKSIFSRSKARRRRTATLGTSCKLSSKRLLART